MPAAVTASVCRPWPSLWPILSASHSRAGVIHSGNPIDLGDVFDFTVYTEVMAAVCRDPEVDAILLHYGPMADFEVAAGREMAKRSLELARAGRQAPGHHRPLHPG